MIEAATHICTHCQQTFPSDQLTDFDTAALCPACLEELTVLCEVCGARIWREGDHHGETNYRLCDDCYEDGYTTCSRCGETIRSRDALYPDENDDEAPYCYQCTSLFNSEKVIHDYSYKPDPIFYGEGSRYLGVELEMDGAGEYDCNARTLLSIVNAEGELAYIKHDGSLYDGLELVTHPMTLGFHEEHMPWEAALRSAIEMGYTSHQAGTCGLHVHVNRSTFGKTEEAQDLCIARLLYFFERHWEELLRFSRRTQRQLEQWAARYGYKDRPMEILEHAKRGGGGGRYSSINLTNRTTIEFRMFRGTLKYNTLAATLQMVQYLCDVAAFLSDDEVKAISWPSFVAGVPKDYVQLIAYLKERRLYVNEPVDGEEDV